MTTHAKIRQTPTQKYLHPLMRPLVVHLQISQLGPTVVPLRRRRGRYPITEYRRLPMPPVSKLT